MGDPKGGRKKKVREGFSENVVAIQRRSHQIEDFMGFWLNGVERDKKGFRGKRLKFEEIE